MADEVKIVVIDGVRYREEDAKRRGLLNTEKEAPAEKAGQPANKAGKPANK